MNNVQLGKFGRNRTTVWEYVGANSFSATREEHLAMHPTIKPIEMVLDAVKDCTHRGEYVIDLFGGSGTTMLAAQQCGRKALLCELDPGYVDLIVKRYVEAFGGWAIHEESGLSYDALAEQRRNEKMATGRKPRHRLPVTQ